MVKIIKENWMLFLILVLALFLRTYRLDYLELFGDEIDAGYQSYSLLTTGSDYKGNFLPSYIHSFSEWRAPALMYAMVPFVKLFGLNEWGVRMGPAVFGVFGILGFYLFLGQIGVSKKVRLITSFLLAITPWHIQYSRATFEVTLLSVFILFGLYFLTKGIRSKTNWLIVISGIFFSLSLYTYSTANILMPLLVLMVLYFYRPSKQQFGLLVIIGIVFSTPLLYQLVFGHASDRFGTLNMFSNKDIIAEVNDYQNGSGNSAISKIFYNKYVVTGRRILFNYSNALGSNFLFNEGDVTFRHSLHQVGNLFWVELPLIILGLYFVIVSKLKYGRILVTFLLISPVAASLTIDGFKHATRLFLLVFPLSFLAAYGLANVKYVKVIFLIVILFEFCRFQNFYWNFYKDQSWRWWHTGYKEAMQYVDQNKDKYDRVMINNTYEPSLVRFLFWNKIDSRLVFNLADNSSSSIDGFNGFCLETKYCFVDFNNKFETQYLRKNVLYLVSQEREAGLAADWSKSPPGGISVLKTVFNYDKKPIFYLVTKL